MADAWGMMVGVFIVAIVAFSSMLSNGWKNLLHRVVPNFLLTILIIGLTDPLLAAYWLLPYVTQRATEPVWDPFSVATLFRNSLEMVLAIFLGFMVGAHSLFLHLILFGKV